MRIILAGFPAITTFAGHWHEEIELTYIYSGHMEYQANEKKYLLSAGDYLFINSKALHTGWAIHNESCSCSIITFHPSLLGETGSLIRQKYVDRILNATNCSSYLFKTNTTWEHEIISLRQHLDCLCQNPHCDNCFELTVIETLIKLWHVFYHNLLNEQLISKDKTKEVETVKEMVQFIQNHYASKLTLNEIANSVNISKSNCNHTFKKYMKETPFEYLLKYRIKISLPLLRSGQHTITEVAFTVGFSGASYYAEIFKRYMGISPRKYIKKQSSC